MMREGQDLKESLIYPIVFQIKKLILKDEKGIVPLEVMVNGTVGITLKLFSLQFTVCPRLENCTFQPQGLCI